jgi:DNA adenine methylase
MGFTELIVVEYLTLRRVVYKNPIICDNSNLEKGSNVLRYYRATTFAHYIDAVENAQKGDFVYLDTPYDPKTASSNFTAYTPIQKAVG